MTTTPQRTRTTTAGDRVFRLREAYRLWPCRVTTVVDVSPRVRRITLSAPEFASLQRTGADEFFGLLMPPPGRELVLPTSRDENIRATIAAMPADVRPSLRWYTVRNHRPDMAEVDVDIVIHQGGPGGAFLQGARPGTVVGYREGCGDWVSPTHAATILLVADETALPAIGAIADDLRRTCTDCRNILAVAEVPDAEHAAPLDAPFPVQWLFRGTDAPGSLALPTVRALDLPTLDHAWICGEQGLAAGIRRHLVQERGMARSDILFSGYWRLGASRE